MKVLSPSLNGNPETDLNNINTPSSLVRLGNRKELNMKKLINWIWSNKQEETEVPVWTFEGNASEPSRDRYNKAHGLGETLI